MMISRLLHPFINPSTTTRRWLALVGLGGLSAAVYWLGLILPYNLFKLGLKPQIDIARLTLHDPPAQAEFILVLAVECGLYLLAWRLCRPMGSKPSSTLWIVLGSCLGVFALSLLWLYPIGATDIFDYIMRGRITAVYGGNPFALTPRVFPMDPFRRYIGWVDYTSTYGPLWELMAAFICHFTGNGILSNVLGFKFLSLIFYAGTTIVIALILTHIAPERAVQGVILFAWNPLTLYDTLGNAHNDIVMIFFILLGVYALLRGHYSWALLALTAGGLIKIVPLILLPLAWMTAWSALRGRGRRLRFTFLTGAACVGLTLAAVAPFLNHWDQLKLLPTLTDLYTTSLPAFVEAQLQPHLGLVSSREIVAAADYTLLAGIVIFQTIRIWKAAKVVEEPIRNRSEAASQALVFVRMAAQMLLFYLVFTCAWFQAWYTLWPLALAALLPSGPIPWTAMLLCYAGLWKTPIFNFLLFRSPVNLPPSTVRETLLGPLTLGVVWAYLAAQAVSQQISRSRRPIRI